MPFTYKSGSRLDNVLLQALAYARKQRGDEGRREDAVFTFNRVTIVVTHNSSLDHIYSAYVDAHEGQTVGPRKLNIWRRLFRASRPKDCRNWKPIEKAAADIALHRLRVLSIH